MVQLLVQSEKFARDLTALLKREGCDVARPGAPDFAGPGVIVADRRALDRYPDLLDNPERVVLIAPNDPNLLSVLWQHNMRSVVFESDPPSTVILAILGTEIGHAGGSLKSSKSNLVVLGSH
jgi:hypothetical protein